MSAFTKYEMKPSPIITIKNCRNGVERKMALDSANEFINEYSGLIYPFNHYHFKGNSGEIEFYVKITKSGNIISGRN
jgi:uncharacterized protein YjlB